DRPDRGPERARRIGPISIAPRGRRDNRPGRDQTAGSGRVFARTWRSEPDTMLDGGRRHRSSIPADRGPSASAATAGSSPPAAGFESRGSFRGVINRKRDGNPFEAADGHKVEPLNLLGAITRAATSRHDEGLKLVVTVIE